MASSLGELFIELGVFADTKELKDFEEKVKKVKKTMDDAGKEAKKTGRSLEDLIKVVKRFTKGSIIGGAIYALNKLTEQLVYTNQQFLNLTRTSDIALSSFQKWDSIGKMFGVEGAAQQLASLNQRLFELKLTGRGAEGFMLAGINPLGQDAEGIMEQLRNRVAGLDDTAAAFLLSQMGLDPSMLHLLRLGRQEFEELGKAIKKYQLTEEQVQEIQRLNIQLQIAQIKFRYLKDRAILALMPLWTQLVSSLARISTGIIKIVDGITAFLNQVPALKAAIIGIGMVVTAVFRPIWALLTGLYLIIDDVMTFLQGGRSGIGYLLYFFDELNQKINSIQMPEWMSKLMGFMQGATTLMSRINPLMWTTNLQGGYDRLWNNVVPATANNISYDNRSVVMNNSISTAQTGQTVMNELSYAQNYAFNY